MLLEIHAQTFEYATHMYKEGGRHHDETSPARIFH